MKFPNDYKYFTGKLTENLYLFMCSGNSFVVDATLPLEEQLSIYKTNSKLLDITTTRKEIKLKQDFLDKHFYGILVQDLECLIHQHRPELLI